MKSSRSKLQEGRIPKKAGSGSKRLRIASPNEDGYNPGHQQRAISSLVQVLQQHPTGSRVTVQPSVVRVLQQHPTDSRVTVQPSVPTTVLQQHPTGSRVTVQPSVRTTNPGPVEPSKTPT
jgi:hypothetical protein